MGEAQNRLQELVAQVAASYFSNSHVAPNDIPTVINQIAASLGQVGAPSPVEGDAQREQVASDEPRKLTPAQVRRSIRPDALVSFEDGRAYKTLRRHLGVRGLTPEQYRQKWGLPADYPMVAPSYSEQRSQLARNLGLGQVARRQAEAPATAEPLPAAGVAPPRRRGRRRATDGE